MRRHSSITIASLSAVLWCASGPVHAYVMPELPRVWVDTTYVEPSGQIITVASGGNFQNAINNAQPGDIIELEAGATFTGNFLLPKKSATGPYIVIRSSRWRELPSPGIRITPAEAPLMPRIISPNVMAAIDVAPGAAYYRFVGIEATFTGWGYAIVSTHVSGVTQLNQYAHHIIFDRCYVHGPPSVDVQRCILANGSNIAVIDSHISDCHHSGSDSQAVEVFDGPGPFKIFNNYLEGAGENVMFGGGAPAMPGMVLEDAEVRGNYFHKPLSWLGGMKWVVKNLFEIKGMRRILIEGNIFENNWAGGQSGVAIVFKANADTGLQAVMEDVTFRHNVIRNSPKGLVVIGTQENYFSNTNTYVHPTNKRILIYNNVFENVGDNTKPGFDQKWIFEGYQGGLDVTFDHNTVVDGQTDALMVFSSQVLGTNFTFTNNIAELGTYGMMGDGQGLGVGIGGGNAALNAYYPGAVVAGNVLGLDGHNSSNYPSGNFWPAKRSSLDIVSWELPPNSVYKGKATDGTDPGVDAATLRARIGGVLPPPSVPGTQAVTSDVNEVKIKVFPNPWRSDRHSGRAITFAQLPGTDVSVEVFTVSGHKVWGQDTSAVSLDWNINNTKGQNVASGLYLYLIKDKSGHSWRGKFAVIR